MIVMAESTRHHLESPREAFESISQRPAAVAKKLGFHANMGGSQNC
jgi:hypothetical protein